ncbi:MAG: hypothetical protein JXA99_15460 [Candidatus Lokiarchaeota archaeon]|nr:hypothetical protein [Candidatus Lokiarchaeota archaeon]
MIEKFLVISYFDMRIGPNILYSKSDIKNIFDFPDLSKILEFGTVEGIFIFSFRKFQTINIIFYMESKLARGGQDLIMISCIIRASYFKNELTDILKYLNSKQSILEKYAFELKKLPNFNLVLHKYTKDPTIKQFTEYCKKDSVDFFSLYDKYYDLIFPESEIKIITQDINLQKKVYLLGTKASGKNTFLKTIETIQFYSQSKLDIPTRILSVLIDNIIIPSSSTFAESMIELKDVQAVIYIVKNIDRDTFNEVNLFIENFISSYSNRMHGKIPLLIINNTFKNKTILREREVKKNLKLKELRSRKDISFKFYSLDVTEISPLLIEPLKWLIKEIFT